MAKCRTCQSNLDYINEHKRWYCSRCKKYNDASSFSPPPYPGVPPRPDDAKVKHFDKEETNIILVIISLIAVIIASAVAINYVSRSVAMILVVIIVILALVLLIAFFDALDMELSMVIIILVALLILYAAYKLSFF